MKKLLALMAVVALTGCATAEEREQARIDEATSACEKYGYAYDSPEWAPCVQREYLANAERRRRAAAAFGAGMTSYSDTMQRQQQALIK